jgi:polysaccharide pyruvyl transferase WcaK-like protein
MGVNALAAGTIISILHQFPTAEIYLLDYEKEKSSYNFQFNNKEHTIHLLNIRFSKKFYLRNNIIILLLLALFIKLIPSKSIRNKLISRNFYLSKISEVDIAAAISGGDSFSDIYGLRRLFYVTLPQLLILLMGKKLVLLPQTIGPFDGKIARIIAYYILKSALVIYSRDHAGLKEMKTFMGTNNTSEKLKFCYDVGFVIDPVQPNRMYVNGLESKREGTIPIIGLNISGLLFIGGYTRDNMFKLIINYRQFVFDLIDFLIQDKNAIVLLVPHVFGSKEDLENDSTACEQVYNSIKEKYRDKIFFVQGLLDHSEIKYIIGRCDFFIGSRMHACIAALSQNIPTVSVAYSKKFYGVMETIGMEKYVADPRIMEQKNILACINEAYEQRALIKQQLQKKMPVVREKILNLFNEILDISGKN